jgi:hypothetical protein
MATVKWQASNPKVQGNVPMGIHDQFAEYAASRDISESKALAEILKRFFQDPGAYPEDDSNHPSDNPVRCGGLSEVMETLSALMPSSMGNDLVLEEGSHSLGIKYLSQKLELALTRIDSMLDLSSNFTQEQQQQKIMQQLAEIQSAVEGRHGIDSAAELNYEEDRQHQSVGSISLVDLHTLQADSPDLTLENKSNLKCAKIVLVTDNGTIPSFGFYPSGSLRFIGKKALFFREAILCNGNDIQVYTNVRVCFTRDYPGGQLIDSSTIGVIQARQAILKPSHGQSKITPEFIESGKLLGEDLYIVLKQVTSKLSHTLLPDRCRQPENLEERQISLTWDTDKNLLPLKLRQKEEQPVAVEVDSE